MISSYIYTYLSIHRINFLNGMINTVHYG